MNDQWRRPRLRQITAELPASPVAKSNIDTGSGTAEVETAPNNSRLDESPAAYVFKQPDTPEEDALCQQALEECPVAAIHNDGGVF